MNQHLLILVSALVLVNVLHRDHINAQCQLKIKPTISAPILHVLFSCGKNLIIQQWQMNIGWTDTVSQQQAPTQSIYIQLNCFMESMDIHLCAF